MFFDILICLFPDFLPSPIHRGPALVLGTAGEKWAFPGSSHITEIDGHSALSVSLKGELIALEVGRDSAGKIPFIISIVTKLFFFFFLQ